MTARLEVPAPAHVAGHLVAQLDEQRPGLAGQRRASQVGNSAVRLQLVNNRMLVVGWQTSGLKLCPFCYKVLLYHSYQARSHPRITKLHH